MRVGFRIAGAVLVVGATAVAADARATDLDAYAGILDRHTRAVESAVGTQVDYDALRHSSEWPALVASLEASDPSQLRSVAQKLAFWINAYNILAIDLVVKGRPAHSIRDLGSLLFPVWKDPAGSVDGKTFTLHQIEHEILRPLGDPRIHAAIVCASTSCPSLLREPWRPELLEAQFERALRAWLADPNKGVAIDRAARSVHLSSIFRWFEEDFDSAGGPLRFVARYLPEADASWIDANAGSVEVGYLEYDWSLNRYR